ncbi:hypothetical protein ACP4OV_015016 [Aristida adscensionis]
MKAKPIPSPSLRPAKNASMASGADRLGALPDELLHYVLSFLPAHSAVATSLLARRWLRLWRSAPALRVTGVKGCANPARFTQFVDNLLLRRHPGARLDSFELLLDGQDFGPWPLLPAFESSVNLWFRHALLCQAWEISLRTVYSVYTYLDDDKPMPLPDVPIISQHLRRLELELVTLERGSLDFSGCPALVDLKMTNCDIFGNVSSPFLKHLNLTRCRFETEPFRARIYMPGLVSVVLSVIMGRTPQPGDMPLLVSAVVSATDLCEDICHKSIYGDCDDHTCSGCYDSDSGANDGRGESILLKG